MKKTFLTTTSLAMCLALAPPAYSGTCNHNHHTSPKELEKGSCLTSEKYMKDRIEFDAIFLKELTSQQDDIHEQLVKALNKQQAQFGDVLKSHMEHLNNAAQKITEGLIETHTKLTDHFFDATKVEMELHEKKMEAGYKAFKEYMDTLQVEYDKKIEKMTQEERAYLVEQLKKYCGNCNSNNKA